MKRRVFMKGAATAGVAGAAVAASTFSTPAIAKGKQKWIGVNTFGKAGLLGRAFDAFAKFVGEASEDRLSIKVYHAGELVKPFETFDAVQEGTAQIGLGAPYYWTGKSNAIQFVAGMPFGLNAQEQNGWLYQAGGLDMCNKVYNELGLQFLPCGNTGNQMGGWYNKEINTAADLDGLKFRMPGLGGEILKTFGVNVILLPGTEVLAALTSGAIDGTEWIGPVADRGKGLYKVAKYYYYPGWHEPGTQLELIINSNAWADLPADLKTIVEAAAASASLYMYGLSEVGNMDAFNSLKNKDHIQVLEFPKEVTLHLAKLTREVLREEAEKDEKFMKVLNSYTEFRARRASFNKATEQSYQSILRELNN